MTTNIHAMSNYSDAITALPDEAFLGSLLFFSICRADVNLDQARAELIAAGLPTDGLRKNLRPVDAFRKASKRFEKKFKVVTESAPSSWLGPWARTASRRSGTWCWSGPWSGRQKRRVLRRWVSSPSPGRKKSGEYVDPRCQCRHRRPPAGPAHHRRGPVAHRAAGHLQYNYDHLLHFMDSHAVRTFVRGRSRPDGPA
jgi:hypothetical protein